jgi:hypothetical protein
MTALREPHFKILRALAAGGGSLDNARLKAVSHGKWIPPMVRLGLVEWIRVPTRDRAVGLKLTPAGVRFLEEEVPAP